MTLLYNATETPATFRCILAISSESTSVQVRYNARSVQLRFTEVVINMENREAYPLLGCTLEPGDTKIVLPCDYGTFKQPG